MQMSFPHLNGLMAGMIALMLTGIGRADQESGPPKQSSPSTTVADPEADHDALRALVPKYEQAAIEGKPELLQPYLDPEFNGVMVTSDEVDSATSLQDYWAKIQKYMGEGGKYRVKVHVAARSILSGDLAVAHGTTSDEVTTAGGKTYQFEGRWTAVCRKRDGQWKILRIHGSMDPILNPFVAATVRGSSIFAGVVAGIVGLVFGWFLHVLWSRRKASATK